MANPGSLDEFGRIARYLAPLAADFDGARGLLDDVAVLTPETVGPGLVVTADALVEAVHFLATDPPESVARKALRVNLSDLASKGAVPKVYFLTLMLPARLDEDWLSAFAEGLRQDQEAFGIRLAGGDSTATSGPLGISITAMGSAPATGAPSRAGAKAGDDLYVSGTIGDGYLGLLAATGRLLGEGAEILLNRYQLPEPRLVLGRAVSGLVTASMDISDGLIADLEHLASASGVDAEVDTPSIPVSAPAIDWLAEAPDRMLDLLTGGDDYELLFSADRSQREAMAEAAEQTGTMVTRIGRIVKGGGAVRLLDSMGDPVPIPDRTGYRHS